MVAIHGKDILQSCAEREAVLRPENNQVINLTTRYTWSGCDITQGPLPNGSMGDWYSCIGGRTFSSIRERWWFLVVDNCKTEKVSSIVLQILTCYMYVGLSSVSQ